MDPVNQKLLELTNLPQDVFYAGAQGRRFFDLQMQLNEFLATMPAPETIAPSTRHSTLKGTGPATNSPNTR